MIDFYMSLYRPKFVLRFFFVNRAPGHRRRNRVGCVGRGPHRFLTIPTGYDILKNFKLQK